MFRKAAELHLQTLAMIGGADTGGENGKTYGLGCAVGPLHVLTAAHVVRYATGLHDGPAAQIAGRGYSCSISYISDELDLAVLMLQDIFIEGPEAFQIEKFPHLVLSKPFYGMTVGYFGQQPAADPATGCMAFQSASLSFPAAGKRWALSNGIMRDGYSGGPCFLPGGHLIGIMNSSVEIRSAGNAFPMMSPLCFAKEELQRVLA